MPSLCVPGHGTFQKRRLSFGLAKELGIIGPIPWPGGRDWGEAGSPACAGAGLAPSYNRSWGWHVRGTSEASASLALVVGVRWLECLPRSLSRPCSILPLLGAIGRPDNTRKALSAGSALLPRAAGPLLAGGWQPAAFDKLIRPNLSTAAQHRPLPQISRLPCSCSPPLPPPTIRTPGSAWLRPGPDGGRMPALHQGLGWEELGVQGRAACPAPTLLLPSRRPHPTCRGDDRGSEEVARLPLTYWRPTRCRALAKDWTRYLPGGGSRGWGWGAQQPVLVREEEGPRLGDSRRPEAWLLAGRGWKASAEAGGRRLCRRSLFLMPAITVSCMPIADKRNIHTEKQGAGGKWAQAPLLRRGRPRQAALPPRRLPSARAASEMEPHAHPDS